MQKIKHHHWTLSKNMLFPNQVHFHSLNLWVALIGIFYSALAVPISLFGFVLLVFYNRGLRRMLSLLFCLHCVLYGQPVSPIICHFQKTTLQHSHPLHAMNVQLWWWVRLCICVLILALFFVTRSNTINAFIKRLSENVWYPRV